MPKSRRTVRPLPGEGPAPECACRGNDPHARFRHWHRDFADVDEAYRHVATVMGAPKYPDDWRATWMAEHAQIRRRLEDRENAQLPPDIKTLVDSTLARIGRKL